MINSMTRDDLHRLADIVREETGNLIQEKNYPMLESRIRGHLLKLQLKSMNEYWEYFEKHERQEREIILSLMTTHYTFFFREFAHFEVLDKWIDQNIDKIRQRYAQNKQPMRIWSAACSRGQEPYSIATFLETHLWKKYQVGYEILATDIDQQSVNFAKNGVYPLKEVNTIPHVYLEGCWRKGTGDVKDYSAAHPNIRAKIKFDALNLFDMDTYIGNQKFDIIFCRNVFIYFSDENVEKVAHNLMRHLNDDGILISGMSESLRFTSWKYPSVGPSCYQKQVAAPAPILNPGVSPALKVVPKTAPEPLATPESEGYMVLCVDDSSTIQDLMKKIFSQDPNCRKVDTALNGREAHEKLQQGKYDLITLDIHMPEVTGIEFLEKFYDKKKHPPVLMVSSVNRTDVELATKSLQLGAFDYVEKPAMNNLQKSTEEILSKTKLALKAKSLPKVEAVGDFDQSIAQKIVVPDASMCLRIVMASPENKDKLKQIVTSQLNEYRSPALLILWKESNETHIASEISEWTKRQLVILKDNNHNFFKPNAIYLVKNELNHLILQKVNANSVSFQVLRKEETALVELKKMSNLQVLLDESISSYQPFFEARHGVKVSDITPATSFSSLSVEFFAKLRKAAA